ncbi:MAG: peptide chain release factor N(5)-glutamine methyltransferase [Clostridia bacterium]|nr:peptide chain release factor N(5)-glutamine methyltransferase [Clostridia bacterium]
MTVSKLFEKGKSLLKNQEIDNFANEARWIFESVFDCGREYLIFHADDTADEIKSAEFIDKIQKRASGVPVQYVVGSWDFYGESFAVGEGVLIPRPETELLVDFALDYLKDKKEPVVVDLCAGSGCIGLTVAKKRPDASVILVEKSAEAFSYLEKNLNIFGCANARIICGDIFDGFESFGIPVSDLILSNPPYIESKDISTLQSEVRYEPLMALDGGDDGYMFYNAIAEKWLAHCSAVAVECGEGQAERIKSLFSDLCADVYSVRDFNGIERTVIGRKD